MANEITPVTVKLTDSVTVNGKTYTEITFTRKLKGKDMVAADSVKGEVLKGHALYASLAGVPLPVIEELNVDDLEVIAEAALPFLGSRAIKMREEMMKKTEENLLT